MDNDKLIQSNANQPIRINPIPLEMLDVGTGFDWTVACIERYHAEPYRRLTIDNCA